MKFSVSHLLTFSLLGATIVCAATDTIGFGVFFAVMFVLSLTMFET
jgi:hypothetical protein